MHGHVWGFLIERWARTVNAAVDPVRPKNGADIGRDSDIRQDPVFEGILANGYA
ncbi:hypothetical protein VR7878_00400 [Vibrio ruber DSM 16370]|uniref:Uncharacterized protein n=1 Tax=Vibrio ruber (strain DSM 16370 / JCM 11486 / BCRC 17186 / CECT 7878 / LMG 23124 / VR1) TaxID=1123498 RepID=A0A1R4LB09_VIBR1|nr:hypothetical protein [Vibrio ruber]SJN53599.1 hypothetical protein VR7878_00400 [Vibrio ruber DSM 16370]